MMKKYEKIISILLFTLMLLGSFTPILEIKAMERNEQVIEVDSNEIILDEDIDNLKEDNQEEIIISDEELDYSEDKNINESNSDKEIIVEENNNKEKDLANSNDIKKEEGIGEVVEEDIREVKLSTLLDGVNDGNPSVKQGNANEAFPIDQDYKVSNIIRDIFGKSISKSIEKNGIKYELDKIVISGQEISERELSLEDSVVSNLDEIVEEIGEDNYLISLYLLDEIKVEYKSVEKIVELKYEYKIYDNYHIKIKATNDLEVLDYGTRTSKIYLPKDIMSMDIKTEQNENTLKVIDNENSKTLITINTPSNYKFNIDSELSEEINWDLEEVLSGELYANPKEDKLTWNIKYSNDSNTENLTRSFEVKEWNEAENRYRVITKKGNEDIDVSEYFDIEILNRSEENKDDKNLYYKDKVSIKINNIEDLTSKVLGEQYENLSKNIQDIEYIIGNSIQTINIKFDYARESYKVNHIAVDEQGNVLKDEDGNELKYSKEITLMPESKYLYIKPQGNGGIIDTNINGIRLIEDGKFKDYYEIDLEELKSENIFNIDIKYGKEDLEEINIMKFTVQDTYINKSGKEAVLGGVREFDGYAGSVITINPPYQHDTALDENIVIKGKRIADYRYKVLNIKEDGQVSVVGYHNTKDNGLNDYINNETEIVESNNVKFRFVDKDHVLYKIIYRAAIGGESDGEHYNLSLSGEDIDKTDILITKYYVTNKNDTVDISQLDLSDRGYTLIKTKDVKGLELADKNNVLKEEEVKDNGMKTKRVYLAGDSEYKVTEDNYEFIYSYGLSNNSLEVAEIDYIVKRENGHSDIYNLKFKYPILKESYTVRIPVDTRYTCLDFDILSGVELTNGNQKEIKRMELVQTGEETYIEVEVRGSGDKIDFPTTSRMRTFFNRFSSKNNDENVNKIIINYGAQKPNSENCVSIDPLEVKEVKVIKRFNKEIASSEYTDKDYFEVSNLIMNDNFKFEGLDEAIEAAKKDLARNDSNVYEYIEYKENEKGTGITDVGGNHIEGISEMEDIDHKKLAEAGEIYINYVEKEKTEIPKPNDDNAFKELYYYIPFSYFEEEMTDENSLEKVDAIVKNLWKIDEKTLNQNDFVYPGMSPMNEVEERNSRYEKKLQDLEGYINEYYEDYKGEESLDYYKNYIAEKNHEDEYLNDYIRENGKETNIGLYIEYLEGLKEDLLNEDNDEEINNEDKEESIVDEPNKENEINKKDLNEKISEEEKTEILKKLNNSIDLANEYKANLAKIDLVSYLRKYHNVPVREYNGGRSNLYTDRHSKNRVLNWNNTTDEMMSNSFGANTSASISYDGINDKGKEVRYTERAKKDTEYSIQPFAISNNINSEMNGFITNLDNPKMEGSVSVDSGFEIDNEIPVIYIQRQKLKKEITVTEKPNPIVSSSISINYVQVKESETNDGKYEIVKNTSNEKNVFYSYRYNNIPSYLVGKELMWRLQDINNMTYINESLVIDAPKENGTTLKNYKTSRKIDKLENEKYEIDLYYIGDVPANLDDSNIVVMGYEKGSNKKLYNEAYKGLVNSIMQVFPQNLEDKDLYLLDKDGNITLDYSGVEVKFPEEKDKIKSHIFYYLEKTSQDKLMRISYLDSDGREISSDDLKIVDKTKDEFTKYPKNIGGYENRIDKVEFAFDKTTMKISIKELSDVLKNKYVIEEDGTTQILKEKSNNKKVVEITELGNIEESKIKFYYDKKQTPEIPEEGGEENEGGGGGSGGGRLPGILRPLPTDELAELDEGIHERYIQGYPDGTVRAEGNITRAEVAAILYRVLPEEERIAMYSTEYNYIDKSYEWSKNYIATLSNGGIIKGYSDGSFRPNDNITRAEVVAMVRRYNNLESGVNPYKDALGHWAEQDIGSVNSSKWIEGYEDGNFRPEAKITRAEFATIINRMLDRGISKENIPLNEIAKFKDLQTNKWYYEEIVEASNSHSYTRTEENKRQNELWIDVIE